MKSRLIQAVNIEDTEEYKKALAAAFRQRMLEELELWSKWRHEEHLKTLGIKRITSHHKMGD